jgi:hypothetical protein
VCFAHPYQIYAGFASIIRCLGGWDAGTKGTVRKDDGAANALVCNLGPVDES